MYVCWPFWIEGWAGSGTSPGKSIAAAVNTIAVTGTIYFCWRAEYGGMKSGQVKRLKELEIENARPRRAMPGSDAGQADPGRGDAGKLSSPARQHRSMQRKHPRGRDGEAALTADIIELAKAYGGMAAGGSP